MKRKCRNCNKNEDEVELYSSRNICKICVSKYNKAHYRANKNYYYKKAKKSDKNLSVWLKTIKEGLSCEICGEDRTACLQFHHIDPSQKEFSISEAITRRLGRNRILKEMSKCQVLCANCHLCLHAK